MDLFQTIVIAIVEGLTEFLPVSSTGHMIIAQNLLNVESTDFVKAFTVIIQFGAILSVVCLYWKRFFRLNHAPAPEGSTRLQQLLHKWDFYWKLLVAFIPAMVLGGLLNGVIEDLLGNVVVVAVMLVLGGVFMLRNDVVVYSNMLGKLAQCCFILALTLSFFHAEFLAWGFPLDRIILWISVGMTICALIDYAVGAVKTLRAKRAAQ